MTIRELLSIITYDEDAGVFIEVIAADGREFELEQIRGSYYENLGEGDYWVDDNYSTEETEDGEEILSSYDVLLTTEELYELEVVNFDIGTYCHTIKARIG